MSIQTQHSLEAAERSGDEVRLAEELRKAKPDVAPTVIGILERARSPRVRNAAALALADMHAANARDSLIGALGRAETRGHRGTILYALDELGANLPLSLLAGIIAGDPYEAREEALGFLASGRVDRDAAPRRVERMLRSALKGADEERSHAIREALGYLSEHFTSPGKLPAMPSQPLTAADRQLEVQAKQNAVQFRFGIQFHVDGPDYRPRHNSAKHNTFRWFKTYAEANKWLRERLPIEGDDRGPYRNRYLAPETVKKTTLLRAVGIIPGRQRPEDDLFEFTVRPI